MGLLLAYWYGVSIKYCFVNGSELANTGVSPPKYSLIPYACQPKNQGHWFLKIFKELFDDISSK